MTLEEIKTVLTKPNDYSSHQAENAVLRLWGSFGLIEYPRKELEQVLNELGKDVALIQAGIQEPTATNRFVLTVLKQMAGDVK